MCKNKILSFKVRGRFNRIGRCTCGGLKVGIQQCGGWHLIFCGGGDDRHI